MVEQGLIHGRDAGHRGNLRPGDRLQRLLRVKAREHDNFPAAFDRAVKHGAVGEDMEEGQHAHQPVDLINIGIDAVDLAGVGGQILVTAHRPLGHAGGTAGILQQRNILVRPDIGGLVIAVIGDQVGKGSNPVIVGLRAVLLAAKQRIEQRLARWQCAGDAADHQPFQTRLFEHLIGCRE